MKIFLATAFSLACIAASAKPGHKKEVSNAPAKNIYDFKIKSLEGGTIDFSQYKGKKILIVNTASKCGFTPQYAGLEKLYEQYKDKLVIVGFPSDNFGGQEYHDNDSIKSFCQKNYGVTFPLTTRVDVKGDKITPVYKYLCNKSENGVLDATISWNFNKFIIDENGNLLAHFDSKVTPDSEELLKYIQ
ncbi:MAG TPA: glutathione peroxidase [Chitinophagaceae bacterium]|jgi:glutathione peroxidase